MRRKILTTAKWITGPRAQWPRSLNSLGCRPNAWKLTPLLTRALSAPGLTRSTDVRRGFSHILPPRTKQGAPKVLSQPGNVGLHSLGGHVPGGGVCRLLFPPTSWEAAAARLAFGERTGGLGYLRGNPCRGRRTGRCRGAAHASWRAGGEELRSSFAGLRMPGALRGIWKPGLGSYQTKQVGSRKLALEVIVSFWPGVLKLLHGAVSRKPTKITPALRGGLPWTSFAAFLACLCLLYSLSLTSHIALLLVPQGWGPRSLADMVYTISCSSTKLAQTPKILTLCHLRDPLPGNSSASCTVQLSGEQTSLGPSAFCWAEQASFSELFFSCFMETHKLPGVSGIPQRKSTSHHVSRVPHAQHPQS